MRVFANSARHYESAAEATSRLGSVVSLAIMIIIIIIIIIIILIMSHNQCMNPPGESTNNKLLWDFKIQANNKIEGHKPDIVVLDKIAGSA